MYNVTCLLISLALLVMIAQAELTAKPYFCDQKDFDEIDGRNAWIHRLWIYEDTVYLVLDTKVIFFRTPKIIKVTTNSTTRLNYLSSLPFFVKKAFESKAKDKLMGLNILRTDRLDRMTEIFGSIQEGKEMTETMEVKFNGLLPVETGNSAFFVSRESYGNYLLKYENQLTRFAFQYEEFRLAMNLTDKTTGKSVEKKFDLSYEVEKAVFFTDNRSLENGLIELDKMRNIHIKEFDLKKHVESSVVRSIDVPVPLVDLLYCHRPLTNFEQVKGIFYYDERQSFYLFVDHFYVKIHEDLVKSSFFVDHKLKTYDENELDLEFGQEDRKSVEFENAAFLRFVKAEKNNVYLTTPNQVFRLSVAATERIQLWRVEKPLLSTCLRQTLEVNGVLFCFRPTTYYRLSESNEKPEIFQIKDLFATAPFRHFDTDERLEFIFNYDDDRVVFMTRKNYLLLYYNFFSVNENNTLIFDYRAQQKLITIKKNCLLSLHSECKRSEIVGERKSNLAFYVIALLPLIGVAFVIGLYISVERNKRLSLKKMPFELSQSQVRQFQGKRTCPRAPDCSVSRSDTYSLSRKSKKSLDFDPADVPAEKPINVRRTRRTESSKPVKAMSTDLNAHIRNYGRRRNR